MKIAVLWTALSGYFNACLRELSSRRGIELLVVHRDPKAEAPFSADCFSWLPNRLTYSPRPEFHKIAGTLEAFAPDVLLLAGWHLSAYRKLAAQWRGRAWRVMAMDNCWRGTLRQRIAAIAAPRVLHGIADAVWVPGEAQLSFARRLGFEQGSVMRGLYCCDYSAFANTYASRLVSHAAVPRRFVYVGRLVPEKGIDTLIDAYISYRASRQTPWPLACCGTGPLAQTLHGIPGLDLQGFVQPAELPEVMSESGCLILPSHFEPWGVVVHEAASTGLLLLASDAVGSARELIKSGINGFTFLPNDVDGLTRLMLRVSSMPDELLNQMSNASHQLASQFTPARWADTLLQAAQARLGDSYSHSVKEACPLRSSAPVIWERFPEDA